MTSSTTTPEVDDLEVDLDEDALVDLDEDDPLDDDDDIVEIDDEDDDAVGDEVVEILTAAPGRSGRAFR